MFKESWLPLLFVWCQPERLCTWMFWFSSSIESMATFHDPTHLPLSWSCGIGKFHCWWAGSGELMEGTIYWLKRATAAWRYAKRDHSIMINPSFFPPHTQLLPCSARCVYKSSWPVRVTRGVCVCAYTLAAFLPPHPPSSDLLYCTISCLAACMSRAFSAVADNAFPMECTQLLLEHGQLVLCFVVLYKLCKVWQLNKLLLTRCCTWCHMQCYIFC